MNQSSVFDAISIERLEAKLPGLVQNGNLKITANSYQEFIETGDYLSHMISHYLGISSKVDHPGLVGLTTQRNPGCGKEVKF